MCGYCGCHHAEMLPEDHHHHDEKVIQIEQDILAENQRYAAENRHYFNHHHISAFNLVSSPGSGKTTLLVKTIQLLKNQVPIYVLEGDQQTDRDAIRIANTGVPVIQINTGKACHLDAHRVGHAVTDLAPQDNSFLFIENVGNLVCPALFDLGELTKVVILSVTEGDDKPLKYPYMFAAAKLMIINKLDLLPYVDFDIEQCIKYAKQINPAIKVLQLSVTQGKGVESWIEWLLIHQVSLS
ncbi:MAG: hydrogenase nickel incorporation protein HypB, partial [Gammaproteobacteria bacterium]